MLLKITIFSTDTYNRICTMTIHTSTIGVEMCFLCCPFNTKKCKSAQENKKVDF